MERIRGASLADRTRLIAYAGVVAAAYTVATIAFGPLSYGPLQFRVAGLLKPLALLSPFMAWAFAVGVALANITSPFGAWDFIAMPVVSFAAARVAWWLRRLPWVAMVAQAALIAAGVAFFPLHLGGGIPVWPTVVYIFASECVLYCVGYALLRNTPLWTAIAGEAL